MPALNVNTGVFYFEKGSFKPNPRESFVYGKNPYGKNTSREYGKGVFSGLMLVGMSGMDGEKYDLNEIMEFVKTARIRQAGDPGSSFILQKGIYKHKDSGKIIEEDSVRVIILNLSIEPNDKFTESILDLADEIRVRFNQDEVIVEFQNKGVTESVHGVKEKFPPEGQGEDQVEWKPVYWI